MEFQIFVLREVIGVIALPLAKLINLCFDKGVFPDVLKISKVIPVFKEGKVTDIENDRPISLVPIFSKIFEQVMKVQLNSFIDNNHVFTPMQFGFRQANRLLLPLNWL